MLFNVYDPSAREIDQHMCFVQFTDESGQRQHVWQTSWAVSTRFVGGIIMTHGDDTGLMLPPKIAPIQVKG